MKRWKSLAAIMATVAVLGGAAVGCSDSDSSEATTPAGATTAPNTAVQTDAEGNTQTEAPDTETDAAPPADTDAGGDGEEVEGDVAAGETTFAAVCQGCHANGGREAAVGPKLSEAGLTADGVQNVIQNGQGAMPAGLVSGDDLENVTAYVLSLQ